MSKPHDADQREQEVRELARSKGYVLRRAHEGVNLWHVMSPDIDGSIYSFSMANPHTFSLEEAEKLLLSKPDKP